MILYLTPTLQAYFPEKNQSLFNALMSLHGETYRALENRHTQRIQLGNQYYFIKQHFGVGWKEIFKNLLQLRWPVLSAKNEWQAIQALTKLHVPTQTMVGYGAQGINPASMRSFIITEELQHVISLEDFCRDWISHPPRWTVKFFLIHEVAKIARRLHTAGINHRDFYICHFLLAPHTQQLFLIDLHRAQIRQKTPLRWIIKDLAGLYFSTKKIGLTQRDLLRFIRTYYGKNLREALANVRLWEKVKLRGDELYQRHEQ